MIQTFDKRWISDYILFIVHICIVHKFFVFTHPLFAYWLVPTLSYSTAPGEQILAYLPFETVHTFTENLKIDAFIGTATYITNGKMEQYATTYIIRHCGFHHRKFIILYSARHERVMTFCPHWIPTHISVICLNDLYIQAYVRQLWSSIIFTFSMKILSILAILQINTYIHFMSPWNHYRYT